MLDKTTIGEAPMFTVFSGRAKGPPLLSEHWDIFSFSPVDRYPMDVETKVEEVTGNPLQYLEPEKDDEHAPPGVDDLDAALTYLNEGGTLVKVPDTLGSPYWRLLVVGEPLK